MEPGFLHGEAGLLMEGAKLSSRYLQQGILETTANIQTDMSGRCKLSNAMLHPLSLPRKILVPKGNTLSRKDGGFRKFHYVARRRIHVSESPQTEWKAGKALPLAAEPLNNFAGLASWGNSKFIRAEALEKSKHLRADSFAVRCDLIVVSDFRAVETPEPAPPAFVTVPPSDLHLHLGNLLLAEKGADVVFEAGGETFAAHRCLIAARSPVFSAELFGEMKESVDTTAVVKIDDMDAQVFKALLYFVYTDTLPEMKREEAGEDAMSQHLLVAADRYNLDRLKLICEDKLCRCIQVSTVATILVLAEQHHCSGLKKACFDFLSSQANLKAAMASDGFEHLSQSCPAIMKELISMLSALVP
uniref:Speckle-type POZ protein n=1 Tax=Aegilops tauschii TaxID=37682 RepID=M8BZA8_AEGTA